MGLGLYLPKVFFSGFWIHQNHQQRLLVGFGDIFFHGDGFYSIKRVADGRFERPYKPVIASRWMTIRVLWFYFKYLQTSTIYSGCFPISQMFLDLAVGQGTFWYDYKPKVVFFSKCFGSSLGTPEFGPTPGSREQPGIHTSLETRVSRQLCREPLRLDGCGSKNLLRDEKTCL